MQGFGKSIRNIYSVEFFVWEVINEKSSGFIFLCDW